MSATQATVGFGTTLKKGASAIPELRRLSTIGGIKRTMVDATNLSSPNTTKEFIAGLIESQQFTAEFNHLPTDATQKAMIADITTASPTFASYSITLPNGTSVWSGSCMPCEYSLNVEPDNTIISTVKFQPTGAWTPPSA